MLDYHLYEGVHNDNEPGSEWLIRRARLGVEHSEGNWEGALEVEFDNEERSVEIKNANLTYEGWETVKVAIGKMKEPFSLEKRTSSLDISTLERSMVTDWFSPGRSIGAVVTEERSGYNWSAGMFRASEDEHGLDTYAATGQAALSPVNRPGAVVHLGISASVRDLDGDAREANEPMEIPPGNKIIETPEISLDDVASFSLEGALVAGPWSLQAEWLTQKSSGYLGEAVTLQDYDFSGYYVLGSYFLTGESRVYDGGSFDRPDPLGTSGAWELVARYGQIDLTDVAGGTFAESVLVGVNWYINENAKVAANLSVADVEGSNSDESGRGEAFSLRWQYEF